MSVMQAVGLAFLLLAFLGLVIEVLMLRRERDWERRIEKYEQEREYRRRRDW